MSYRFGPSNALKHRKVIFSILMYSKVSIPMPLSGKGLTATGPGPQNVVYSRFLKFLRAGQRLIAWSRDKSKRRYERVEV